MNPVADFLVKYFLHWIPRYVMAWLLALTAAGIAMQEAWTNFDNTNRADGNAGHTAIDFGGQWCMGRMLVTGNGRHLYNRNYQRLVVLEAYPRSDEVPDDKRAPDDRGKHDAEGLVGAFMGEDHPEDLAAVVVPLAAADSWQLLTLTAEGQQHWQSDRLPRAARAIGGPLYPPINAVVYYPLALLTPQQGYRSIQILNLVLVFVTGLAIRSISRGRIWTPLAATAVMLFPHFSGSINLGQNATLTLAMLAWGWALMARGHDGWAGVLWGLLAFKPVWALAFLLVLLMTRRWRFALAMVATSAVLCLATLPLVGIQSWFDWLEVGHDAAVLYNTDKNWIFLSRDILSMPRRFLIKFDERPVPDNMVAHLIGWPILLSVFFTTAGMALIRWREAKATTGPVAAFLLLGGWLSCYHFMYYDVLLASLPVLLLFTEPRGYFEPIHVAIVPIGRSDLDPRLHQYYRPSAHADYPEPLPYLPIGHSNLWVLNRMVPSLMVVLAFTKYGLPRLGRLFLPGTGFGEIYGDPWDTYCLMVLWLWCGGLWLWQSLKRPVATYDDAAEPSAQPTGNGHVAPGEVQAGMPEYPRA